MTRELPSSHECFTAGLVSLVVWTVIFPLSFSCFLGAVNRYTRRIFLSLTTMGLLEIPWAMQLTIHQRYTGQFTYSLHLLSSIFFLYIFCTFCFAVNDVLRSGEFGSLYVGTIKRKKVRVAMLFANLFYSTVVLIALVILYMSDDLDNYFSKRIYRTVVWFGVLQNMSVGVFLTVFIMKLRTKLSVGRTRDSTSMEVLRSCRHTPKIMTVANKLSTMLVIFMFCFALDLIRVCWWFSPTNPRYAVDVLAPQSLESIDTLWWLVFSVIPRTLPPAVFIFTMGWPSKYLFRIAIPDKTIDPALTEHLSSNISSGRPRQGSDESEDDRNSLYLHEMKRGRSKDMSVDSDDGQHLSSIFDLNRLSEDFVLQHPQSGDMENGPRIYDSSKINNPIVEIEAERDCKVP